jgi:hypothetical protein
MAGICHRLQPQKGWKQGAHKQACTQQSSSSSCCWFCDTAGTHREKENAVSLILKPQNPGQNPQLQLLWLLLISVYFV